MTGVYTLQNQTVNINEKQKSRTPGEFNNVHQYINLSSYDVNMNL